MDQERLVEKVYGFPVLLSERKSHFCPGCSHGILSRLIAESIFEMGLAEKAIGVYGTGCASLMYEYIEVSGVASPPGAAPGIATGLKRAAPESLVFTYQGDGDLFYDLTTLMGAAMRGEGITIICENNFNMGMSGGFPSPTTPLGFATSNAPGGRTALQHGYPLGIAELLQDVKGVNYLARGSTHTPGAVRRVKGMIRKAFSNQIYGTGLGFVEVLGMCPTNFALPPIEAAKKLKDVTDSIPMGELKRR
jgi:2-oxoglutarate ferredoxin oxidoreductase subunit beta